MNVTQAIIELFAKQKEADNRIHSLTVYRRGEKIVSIAPPPFDINNKNHVYSLSKSFCSTAVGIACDLGYLSLDERIVDIFPDKCPEEISENLSKMTLYNVLSMNCGHEGCVMNKMVNSDDPVKAFLAQEVKFVPGTHFAYNTGATYLASACVTKRTGLTALDFLEKHLFKPLGICGSMWYSHAGITEGGVGFHVSTEDAAKLGLLYMNGGIWQGKRLLSKSYIKTASSPISDNSSNGNPDWTAGYGLQFWRNTREGYRGDGAYGQLCVILPKRDMVIAMFAECADMQTEMNILFDFVDNVEKATGKADYEELNAYLADYYPASELSDAENPLIGKIFALDENKCGFSVVRFEKADDGIDIYLSDKTHVSKIPLRSGRYESGVLYGKYAKPVLENLTCCYDVPLHFCSTGSVDEKCITAVMLAQNCPHTVTYKFELCGDDKIKITRDANRNIDHAVTFTGSELE